MTDHSVHWYEGMFLWPHQVQLAERLTAQQLHLGHKWNLHYDWGLRAIQFDRDALANYRFAVRSLEARLRDGTTVSLPEDGALAALDLKEGFGRDLSVTVYLAVPKLQLGKANVTDPAELPRTP